MMIISAVIATIFIFLPSFMLLVGIEPYFSQLRRFVYFNRSVQGILYSFVGLLISVAIKFCHEHFLGYSTNSACVCSPVGALSLEVDIAWIVLAGALISAIVL